MPLSRLDLITAFGDACDLRTGVVFVGAGLSQSVGLPGWAKLLETPLKEAGVPDDQGADLPLLAEYAVTGGRYTRIRLEDHILEQVNGAGAKHSGNHVSLARLPVDQIWTTNYDPLIEGAAKGASVIAVDDDIQLIGTARQTIIKMHGSIDPGPPPAWTAPPIITRSDFENYETTHRRTWAVLQAAYLSKTFLFLGFSFADPNVEILQRLSRIHGTAAGNRHMTIMRRPPATDPGGQRLHDLRVRDLEDSGVKVHEIDEYDELSLILTDLVRRTRKPRLFISGSGKDDGCKGCCAALARVLIDKTSWELCSLGGDSGWHTTLAVANVRRAENTYDASSLVFHFRGKNEKPPQMEERIGTAVYTDLEREPLVQGLLDESRAVVVVGGSKRTTEEIGWAESCGAGIVPLARSGGAALEYWKRFEGMQPPELGGQPVEPEVWARLNADAPEVAARAAARLLDQAMYSSHPL